MAIENGSVGASAAGDVKASVLIEWLKTHLGDGYVYGAVGQICTVSLLQVKQRQYGAMMGNGYFQLNGDYHKGKCARWLGRWVADCSGLIKAGRRELTGVYRDVSAQGTYNQCSRKGLIKTMPRIPGCTVYMWSSSKNRMSHVGTYIGGGYVIEAMGAGEGIVKTQLTKRKWGYWGLLDWLILDLPNEGGGTVPDSDATPGGSDGADPLPDDRPCEGIPKLEALGDSGYNVKLLQQWLNLHGTTPRLMEDGIFGSKTETAVNAFKQANGLDADGVSCIDTWSALIVPPPKVQLTLSTVRRGSTGILVTLLQRLLYTAGVTPWLIDGYFGSTTDTSVKVYQKSKGLEQDGIVGPLTWAALTGQTQTTPVTVKIGDSGPEVVHLQKLVDSKGFSPGAIDGQFGPKTQKALKSYQSAVGLPVSGIADANTWEKLASDDQAIPQTVKRGDENSDVERLQGLLTDQGFQPGAMDAIFGPQTEGAVKAYQQAKGLSVDGIVGPLTWAKLLGVS